MVILTIVYRSKSVEEAVLPALKFRQIVPIVFLNALYIGFMVIPVNAHHNPCITKFLLSFGL